MTTIESSPDAVTGTADDAAGAFGWLVELLTSTDHKVTARLYLAGGLIGLAAIVVVNVMLGLERLDGDDVLLHYDALPQLLDAQHVGFVFAVLAPLAMAACVGFVPLQVGARSIAFGRLASMGFWAWFGGLVLTAIALANDGGTLGGDGNSVDLYIAAIGLMAVGLVATAAAIATTVLTTRAPGMTMRRVPAFAWSALVYSLGLILVLPTLLGTLVYLFVDHRNGRTGFGGNTGIVEWAGWAFTQPVTLLFAIPAVGLLAELAPVAFGRRTPARGVLFGGIALIGMAALAGVTQQAVQNLPWAESRPGAGNPDQQAREIVPFLLFNALPLLGAVIVVLVILLLVRAHSARGSRVSGGFVFAAVAFGMLLVALVANVLYAIDDLELQGTVFSEGVTVLVAYGAALGTMGALCWWSPKLWGVAPAEGRVVPIALLGAAGAFFAGFPLLVAGFLDQEAGYAYTNSDLAIWNILSLFGHVLMALTLVGFVGQLIGVARRSAPAADDPWDAYTIEWATTSPAPRGNFVDVPVVNSAEPLLDMKLANTNPANEGSA